MKIKIPRHRPVPVYSDTAPSISIPGYGPVEVAGGYTGTAMQFENGDVMLFEDGTVMIFE